METRWQDRDGEARVDKPQVFTLPTLQLLRHAGESFSSAQRALSREIQTQLDTSMRTIAHVDRTMPCSAQPVDVQKVIQFALHLYSASESVWALYKEATLLVHESHAADEATSTPLAGEFAKSNATRQTGNGASCETRGATASARDRALSRNDQRILDYLLQALSNEAWTRLTLAEISAASKVPMGSVSMSLKRLQRAGVLLMEERGQYRIA